MIDFNCLESWEHFISVQRAAVVSSSRMNLEPARQNVWSALRKRVILRSSGQQTLDHDVLDRH
jgi:hypothetical protein